MTMTKREIMVRAHEIARTLEGNYAARMSYGLRRAWLEARLIAKGGRLWEKAGMRRLYFNNLAELYGLELEYYKTGKFAPPGSTASASATTRPVRSSRCSTPASSGTI